MTITNTKFLGRNFTLAVETSASVFTVVGGMRATGLTINAEVIDTTDKDDDTWKKMIPGGIRSLAISASGLVSNALAFEKMQDVANTGTTINAKVVLSNGQAYSAPFLVTSLEQHGEYNGAQMFSASLVSMNTPTVGVSTTPTLEFEFFDSGSIQPTTGTATMTFSRSTSAVYRDIDGFLKTAAANVARFECDVNGNRLGYLPEPASTNLLLQSQNLNATWSLTNVSVVFGARAVPDGTLTSNDLVETATNANHGVVQSITKAASAIQYATSFFFKPGTRTTIRLAISDGGSNSENVDFDTVAMTATASIRAGAGFTSPTATIEQYANGFYRCTFVGTSSSTTTVTANIFLLVGAAGSAESYAGTSGATGGTLWGIQIEAQPQATSYIATTSAQVSRTADVLTATSITGFSTTGTTAVEFIVPATSSGVAPYIVSVNDGTVSNYAATIRNANNGQVATDEVTTGSSQGALSLGTPGLGTLAKVAHAFAANDAASTMNGATVTTDATVSLPVTNRIDIGNIAGFTTQQPARPIRRLAYYNTRLANADLIALTE